MWKSYVFLYTSYTINKVSMAAGFTSYMWNGNFYAGKILILILKGTFDDKANTV